MRALSNSCCDIEPSRFISKRAIMMSRYTRSRPPSSTIAFENGAIVRGKNLHGKTKLAQASASWLSGGCSQRQIIHLAAPSFGQPRPISRLGGISAHWSRHSAPLQQEAEGVDAVAEVEGAVHGRFWRKGQREVLKLLAGASDGVVQLLDGSDVR
eukprot:scaffold71152_cov73-Phaeocystis_antarctica.AAC.4